MIADWHLSPLQLNLIIGFGGFVLGAVFVPPLLWLMKPKLKPPTINLSKGTADEWHLSDI